MSDITIGILIQLVESGLDATLDGGRVDVLGESLEGLGDVETNVGDRIVSHSDDEREERVGDDFSSHHRSQHSDGEEGGHAVEVVGMREESQHFGDDVSESPLHSKHFRQLFEVVGGCFSDGEDGISQPSHAQVSELLVEEVHSQLSSQEGNVLYDGQSHSPLFVLSQLHNRRKQILREEIDSYHTVHSLQLGDDVEADFRDFVLQ